MELGHRLVSDGMVLQRGEDFFLSGTAKGEKVSVSFAGSRKEVRCSGGRFEACFEKPGAGGPYTLEVCGEGISCKIEDILVGDVYFMSGQSNMELDINWVYHSFAEEIDAWNCDQVRQFKVPVSYKFVEPQQDTDGGSWVKAQGEAKNTFGAIGFFMAKKLYGEKHIPIGLIQTAVPGCPIESFLTKENAGRFGEIKPDEICHSKEEMRRQTEKEQQAWDDRVKTMLGQDDKTQGGVWKRTVVPFWWELDQEQQAGIVTLEKDFVLDDEPAEDAVLQLGLMIEADETYINDSFVGRSEYQYLRRRYVVPKTLLHRGKNCVRVKLIVTNGTARVWEKLPCDITVGGRSYDLTGVWRYRMGKFSPEGFFPKTFYEYLPCGVYQAMIAPLMEAKAAALLWYQGESNTVEPEGYLEKFKLLVRQFRDGLGQPDLPVYYVQLAGYEDPCDPDGTGWESIRRQQEQAQEIPGAHMIVSMDVGSPTDLHPQNKKAIGERIAERIL